MKIFFRNIHLYLGLASGIVIAITCFTGATLVFEKELQQWIYPERYRVEKKEDKVSIQSLITTLQQKVPQARVSSVKIYNDPTRTVELSYQEKPTGEPNEKEEKKKNSSEIKRVEKEKKPEAGKGGGGANNAFMNPYTGELISLYSYRNTFFYTMFSLHRWLLAGDVGKLIVGISTTIFLFILITGIILWWPKNQKKLKQRLKVKWQSGWKRVNHDLHISIGFYASIFLFTFAFTGLAWSFQWFNNAIYWVTGTENKRPDPPHSTYQAGIGTITYDHALQAIRTQVKNAQYYSIVMPQDTVGAISITAMPNDPVHEKASNQYFLDQYTGSLIGAALYEDRNLGQRVRSTFYPIHVGSIGGLPGRILAFLACIAGFTFPITGTILWLNRLKKEKKKSEKKSKDKITKVETSSVL